MNEQATMMNQQQQQHQSLLNLNPNLMSTNQINPHQQLQPQRQMFPINRSYGAWSVPPPQPQLQFQNHNPNIGAMKPPASAFNKPSHPLGPRSNWKGKRINKPKDQRRREIQKHQILGAGGSGPVGGVNIINGVDGNMKFTNYNLPTLNELQYQNRLKTRRYFPKKKFNNDNMNMNMGYGDNFNNRFAPFAPRNTTSFLIRAKKSGGIASLVSPCPVTPSILPSPIFSPSPEVLVDMAKEKWGVDGYGSMKGLIRLRSPGHGMEVHEDDEDDGSSSESDVEEHVEVERRLDHDLSRFEMIYNPNNVNNGGMEYHVLENRVDDQDTQITQLEEENMILKERLFLMERELGDLTRRLQRMERRGNGMEDNEEVAENESENESESHEYAHSMEENNDELSEENVHVDGVFKGKDCDNDNSDFHYKVEKDNITENDKLVVKSKNMESSTLGEREQNEMVSDKFEAAEFKTVDNEDLESS